MDCKFTKSSIDSERFARACDAASARVRDGIGTMGEKGIHHALKHYFEPDTSCHEVAVGGYIADIVGEDGIIEIQSAGFYRMKDKLSQFLDYARVTIVYPCVVNKRIIKLDPDSGEVISIRRSPRHKGEYDIFSELRAISQMAAHERLTVCIAMLEADEYRCGEKKRRRRNIPNKVEILPTALTDLIYLRSPEDTCAFCRRSCPSSLHRRIFPRCAV